MGTLGCVDDMRRRDKENRELRRVSRERLNETRNRLMDIKSKRSSSDMSHEKMDRILHEGREWRRKESDSFFKGKLVFFGFMIAVALLVAAVVFLFYGLLS